MATIYRGNTWNPSFIVKKDGVNFNCTDYTIKAVIKSKLLSSDSSLFTLSANWIDQANGQGNFKLESDESKTLTGNRYYFAAYLYKTSDQSLVKTFQQEELKVEESLVVDFPIT